MQTLLRIRALSETETYLENGFAVETSQHPAEFYWINPKQIICIEPIELYHLGRAYEADSELLSYYQKTVGDKFCHLSKDDNKTLSENIIYFKNGFYHYWVKDSVKIVLSNGKVIYSPQMYKNFASKWRDAGFDMIDLS